MPSLVEIVAILRARPGKAEDLRLLLDGMAAASQPKPGTTRFDPWQDRVDPDRFVLDEFHADADVVAAHCASPSVRLDLSVIGDLAERIAVTLDSVDRADDAAPARPGTPVPHERVMARSTWPFQG